IRIVATKVQQLIAELNAAACPLLGHELGAEQFGEVDWADIAELVAVIGDQLANALNVDWLAVIGTKCTAPIDAGEELIDQAYPFAIPHAFKKSIHLTAIVRQFMGGFG